VTCHRFGRLRPVAAVHKLSQRGRRRQVADLQSADRSAHSKSPRAQVARDMPVRCNVPMHVSERGTWRPGPRECGVFVFV